MPKRVRHSIYTTKITGIITLYALSGISGSFIAAKATAARAVLPKISRARFGIRLPSALINPEANIHTENMANKA